MYSKRIKYNIYTSHKFQKKRLRKNLFWDLFRSSYLPRNPSKNSPWPTPLLQLRGARHPPEGGYTWGRVSSLMFLLGKRWNKHADFLISICLFEICSQNVGVFLLQINTYHISSYNSILPIRINRLPYVYSIGIASEKPSSRPAVCGNPPPPLKLRIGWPGTAWTAHWCTLNSREQIGLIWSAWTWHCTGIKLHCILACIWWPIHAKKDPILRHAMQCTSSHNHGDGKAF